MHSTLKLEIAHRGPLSVTHDPRGQMHIATLVTTIATARLPNDTKPVNSRPRRLRWTRVIPVLILRMHGKVRFRCEGNRDVRAKAAQVDLIKVSFRDVFARDACESVHNLLRTAAGCNQVRIERLLPPGGVT